MDVGGATTRAARLLVAPGTVGTAKKRGGRSQAQEGADLWSFRRLDFRGSPVLSQPHEKAAAIDACNRPEHAEGFDNAKHMVGGVAPPSGRSRVAFDLNSEL